MFTALKNHLDRLLKKIGFKQDHIHIHDITNSDIDVKVFRGPVTIAKEPFLFNEHWFKKQCEISIVDLGRRYTPKLNVELEIAQVFEGLGRTEVFRKKFEKLLDELLLSRRQIVKEKDAIKEYTEKIKRDLDVLINLFEETEFTGIKEIKLIDFDVTSKEIRKNLNSIYDFYKSEEAKLQEEKGDYRYYHKYGLEIRDLRDFRQKLDEFEAFLNSTTCRLAINPFFLIEGEAGIGKSHLLADIITKRMSNNYSSVFLLGQHFNTEEDPWTQIFKNLQIDLLKEEFLHGLNDYGKSIGKRVVIFIDAVNEGKGKLFWTSFISSFIKEVKGYEWLGLVLTVRSSYKRIIFPEDDFSKLELVEYHHIGFANFEYEASKIFFEEHGIEAPKIPLLHPEFQNPLFLMLFCQGIQKAGLTHIPDGLNGITAVIGFFIKNVNRVLSEPNRINYSDSLGLVQKSVHAIIKYKIENDLQYVQYEKAHQIVYESVSAFVSNKGFIDELISEGVFSKNVYWVEGNEYEEGVYLVYERFEDHLTAKYLLETYPNFDEEFKEGGNLFRYVKDEDSLYRNKGLIDAFSIQIPELKGKEFSTYVPAFIDSYPIIESFINSLLWRKHDTINEESKRYANECAFLYNGTSELFWEVILAISSTPGHSFNALSLHKHLMQFTLAERDADWTQFIKERYTDHSSVKRLIDWAWKDNDKSCISDDSIKLSGITLAWFLTSTNRELRDKATKALVSLFQDKPKLLIELIQLFEQVNDLYILERLYAVAYGCALRTTQTKDLKELSEYIHKTIFNDKHEVIPHILLRDYARGVIEYSNYLGIKLSFSMDEVRPPYNSIWPENIPTENELKEKFDNDNYAQLWGSVMGFGDFARYIIGTNHFQSDWSGVKRGDEPVDRDLVFERFKKKMTSEQEILLNDLNPIITKDPDKSSNIDDFLSGIKIATGRKSKEELLKSKEAFKASLSLELLLEYESQIEPYLNDNNEIINTGQYFDLRVAQRFIFNRTIDLGWQPELHLELDNNFDFYVGRNARDHERIGKKYQWIAYYEYLARLSDNFIKYNRWGAKDEEKPYEGPWDPNRRDIDPSVLIKKTGVNDDELSSQYWSDTQFSFEWNRPHSEWLKDTRDLPSFDKIIEVADDKGENWLVLERYPNWSEPRKIGNEKWGHPYKDIASNLSSFLIKSNEFDKFKVWAMEQNFWHVRIPESIQRYEVFNREYYWSHAHHYFENMGESGQWDDIVDESTHESIAKVNVTTLGYLWEEEYDKSKEHRISFLMPNRIIFEGMNLMFTKREGEFVDDEGNVQCFAPDVYYTSKSQLLVRKLSFVDFLEKNDLKVVWIFEGAKRVIGGRDSEDYFDPTEFSGFYYLENDKLKGHVVVDDRK